MIRKVSLAVLGKKTHPIAELIASKNLGKYMNFQYLESESEYPNAKNPEAAFVIDGNPKSMEKFLTIHPGIKWVHSAMAGLDWIMNDTLRNSQISLTNAKGCYNESLAEFVTYAVLHFSKKMPEHIILKRAHKWEKQVVNNAIGSIVTIFGYGSIGSTCAKMLKNGLKCKIIGVTNDPQLLSKEQLAYADEIISDGKYENAIGFSDFVVGILPKTEKTVGIFNEKFFNKMKCTAAFINIGRGPTLVEDDLMKVINEKKIYGAALDVYPIEPLPPTSKLWDSDNVLMTFHDSDLTVDYWNLCVDGFAEELMNYSKGLPFKRLVNKTSGY